MRSPTFAHEDALQNPEQATEVQTALAEAGDPDGKDDPAGKDAAVKLRRRKNVVDVESQTDDVFDGDQQPENPGVISESTQCAVDSQTMAQHPFSSCTAVNCLVCATIGKNKLDSIR